MTDRQDDRETREQLNDLGGSEVSDLVGAWSNGDLKNFLGFRDLIEDILNKAEAELRNK